jgi:hypothetical protein
MLGMDSPSAQQSTPSPTGTNSASLPKRQLASLQVTALGFGCMNLAGIYKPATDFKEAVKVLRAA